MDFSFTEEQQMLLDTTRRFIAERYGFEFRNTVRDSAEGWSRDTWKHLGDLGLLAIGIPEDEGGIGAGPVGAMLVGNAVGEGLLLEPFLASAVVATQAILALGSPAQREHWFPRLSSGEVVAVLMPDEAGTGEDPLRIDTRATRDGDGWCLRGEKALAYHAPIADLFTVFARTDARLTWRPRGAAGRWELYAEVINVLNRKNAGALDPRLVYDPASDRPAIVEQRDQAFPRLPTIGVRYRL